ncbi:hypothetical protein RFI_33189 [Reticulomyxa filosa]|uniref:Uncharacterized protein n=1 Tax=Reticulomyxa filosa TaxID=46433 RepID=X6LQP4_RETFI|nr:hypothetical protein RFI_33189 [Reticulomyxa filosa]|eukprot:ETO04208.1 hypothetical protein RFI_33189 [Reticulomyxa filosa]
MRIDNYQCLTGCLLYRFCCKTENRRNEQKDRVSIINKQTHQEKDSLEISSVSASTASHSPHTSFMKQILSKYPHRQADSSDQYGYIRLVDSSNQTKALPISVPNKHTSNHSNSMSSNPNVSNRNTMLTQQNFKSMMMMTTTTTTTMMKKPDRDDSRDADDEAPSTTQSEHAVRNSMTDRLAYMYDGDNQPVGVYRLNSITEEPSQVSGYTSNGGARPTPIVQPIKIDGNRDMLISPFGAPIANNVVLSDSVRTLTNVTSTSSWRNHVGSDVLLLSPQSTAEQTTDHQMQFTALFFFFFSSSLCQKFIYVRYVSFCELIKPYFFVWFWFWLFF